MKLKVKLKDEKSFEVLQNLPSNNLRGVIFIWGPVEDCSITLELFAFEVAQIPGLSRARAQCVVVNDFLERYSQVGGGQKSGLMCASMDSQSINLVMPVSKATFLNYCEERSLLAFFSNHLKRGSITWHVIRPEDKSMRILRAMALAPRLHVGRLDCPPVADGYPARNQLIPTLDCLNLIQRLATSDRPDCIKLIVDETSSTLTGKMCGWSSDPRLMVNLLSTSDDFAYYLMRGGIVAYVIAITQQGEPLKDEFDKLKRPFLIPLYMREALRILHGSLSQGLKIRKVLNFRNEISRKTLLNVIREINLSAERFTSKDATRNLGFLKSDSVLMETVWEIPRMLSQVDITECIGEHLPLQLKPSM